jgi:hypothetical protein
MNSVSNSYIKQVLKQVKFIVDHRSIKRELNSHIQDLMDEHQWHNLSEDELNLKILEEMGDPIDLGKSLNQVHKPILGYIWVLTRSIFIIVLCLSSYNIYKTLVNTSQSRQTFTDEKLIVSDIVNSVGESLEIDYSNLKYRDWDIHEVIEFDYSYLIFERIILTENNSLILVYHSQTKFNLLNKYSFPFVFNNLEVFDQDGNQYYPTYDVQMLMNNMMISQYIGVPFDTQSIKMDFKQVKESFTFTVSGDDYE